MNTLKMGAVPSEDLQGSTGQSGEMHGLQSHEDADLNPGSAIISYVLLDLFPRLSKLLFLPV